MKVECNNISDIENNHFSYISWQDLSHVGLVDQNNKIDVVDTASLTLFYRREVYDMDCK